MKIPLAITSLILAGVAALSWWQQAAVAGLREEQAALRAEAVALGLSVDEAADGQTSQPRRASRQRQERVPQDVNAVAADVVQLLRDIKEGKLETSGKSAVERISEIFERLYQLDAAQVRQRRVQDDEIGTRLSYCGRPLRPILQSVSSLKLIR